MHLLKLAFAMCSHFLVLSTLLSVPFQNNPFIFRSKLLPKILFLSKVFLFLLSFFTQPTFLSLPSPSYILNHSLFFFFSQNLENISF